MMDRPYWNTTARSWNRRPGVVVVSLDPLYREVTVRTPPGEMAGMNEREVRAHIANLEKALEELGRRE